MSQSGSPTAVGACVESAWGTAPITVVSGNNYALGIANTNPHRFWTTEPGGGFPVRPTIVVPADEHDGDIELLRTILTRKDYDGDYSWKADGENLFYALLGMFGKDTVTMLNGSSTTTGAGQFVASHAFTPSNKAPTFTMEEGFGDKSYGRVNTGVCVASLMLDLGAIVTARMGMYAKRQVPNYYPDGSNVLTNYDFSSSNTVIPNQMGGNGTKAWKVTQSPTFIDVQEVNNGDGPFVFGSMKYGSIGGAFAAAFITVDGNAVAGAEILEGASINIGRAISRHMIGGSGFEMGAVTGNHFSVGGNMTLLFEDNSWVQAIYRKSKVGLNLKFDSVPIGGTAYKYTLEIYLPWVNFLEGGVSVPSDAITVGGNFVARKDPSLGYTAKITLINAFNPYSLGGATGTSPGGLGGHTIV